MDSRFKEVYELEVIKVLCAVSDKLNIESFLIGGYVRDFLLNRKNEGKDLDIVVIGSGIELAKEVQKKLPKAQSVKIFKTYGTAMVQWNEITLEFVGSRKESYQQHSRNPVIEVGTLEDDQNRRDFTINALAIGLNSSNRGKLLDPFDGEKDLKNKILKTPLSPDLTFSDDPLRMLRAIRFASQLNFEIEEKTLEAIRTNKERIHIVSKERIVVELNKILLSEQPSIGFLHLEKVGILSLIIPELVHLKGITEVEGKKHKDNFYHTLEVVDNICTYSDSLWLRWAALLHDIGKAPTKRFDKQIGWTFHGHEFKGSKMVYSLFKRLRLPLNEKMKYVQKMVRMSSRPIIISEDIVTDSAVRRLVFDAGDDLTDLILLCKADITTKNEFRFKKYHQNFEIVKKKITEVEERDRIRNFQPPVSGEEIMAFFNIKPCREVGEVKEKIKEAILEGEISNDREKALELMKKIGVQMNL